MNREPKRQIDLLFAITRKLGVPMPPANILPSSVYRMISDAEYDVGLTHIERDGPAFARWLLDFKPPIDPSIERCRSSLRRGSNS